MRYLLTNNLTRRRLTVATWPEVESVIGEVSRQLASANVPHLVSRTYGCIVGAEYGNLILELSILPGNTSLQTE